MMGNGKGWMGGDGDASGVVLIVWAGVGGAAATGGYEGS